MSFLLEIDRSGDEEVVFSFIQILYRPDGLPLGANRFSIPLRKRDVDASHHDPSGLRLFIEYDHEAAQFWGVFKIIGVGLCTVAYMSTPNETLAIYHIPDLIHFDQYMRVLHPQT